MQHRSRTCERVLIFGITGHGWVWNCDWPGVRASHARTHDHDCDREVGINDTIGDTVEVSLQFREIGVSNCQYGCKVYVNRTTGERVLAHNSAYGCNEV